MLGVPQNHLHDLFTDPCLLLDSQFVFLIQVIFFHLIFLVTLYLIIYLISFLREVLSVTTSLDDIFTFFAFYSCMFIILPVK